MKTFLDLQYITNLSLFKEVRTPYFFQCMYNSFWFQPFWSCSHWISVCSFQTVSTGDLTQGQKTPHDHQPMAIFQSALLPPPPTLPAPCSPIFFPCREGRGRRESEREREKEREIRPHIQIQASTPSLRFPRHLCTSLCLQLHNNKALNLCRGVNPSPERGRAGDGERK